MRIARVPKRKGGLSPTYYTVKYLRRSRELYRKYLETKPWIKQLYTSFFRLKPGIRIVDVGCGTGDFTRYLVGLIPGKYKAVGIDQRGVSLRSAEAETRKAGMSDKISYKKGDAYQIPIDDDYADLVSCRTLLMHLQEPLKAVREMARITKPDGHVIAVEGGKMSAFCDPNDEDYTRLSKQAGEAWTRGIRRLEGKEFGIGEKLPGMFQQAGLGDIRAEVQADAWLDCDPTRKLSDVKAQLRFEFSLFKESKRRDRRYLLAGGIPERKTDHYLHLYERRAKMLLSDDQKLRNNPTFYAATLFLVSGRKIPENP